MLEWRRLAANRKVRRMSASIPNTAPVVHFTPSRSRYQFILLGEQRQRHTCANNLPRVAPSGGTAGNRTCNLSIMNPDALLLHHQATQWKHVNLWSQVCLPVAQHIQSCRYGSSTSAVTTVLSLMQQYCYWYQYQTILLILPLTLEHATVLIDGDASIHSC